VGGGRPRSGGGSLAGAGAHVGVSGGTGRARAAAAQGVAMGDVRPSRSTSGDARNILGRRGLKGVQ